MSATAVNQQVIVCQRPSSRNVLIFWLIVFVMPLLIAKMALNAYFDQEIASRISRSQVITREDVKRFERLLLPEPFVEAMLLNLESDLALPQLIDTEIAVARPRNQQSPDAESFLQQMRQKFKEKIGSEPLLIIADDGSGRFNHRYLSQLGEKWTGFLGNSAVRIFMTGLRGKAEKGERFSEPAIFWQLFKSAFGTDMGRNLQNRVLQSDFSGKLGGRRLFFYFNYFPRENSLPGRLQGYLLAFFEDQIDRRKQLRWAMNHALPRNVKRNLVVKSARFRLVDSSSAGKVRSYLPFPIQSLRMGSHGNHSMLQNLSRNGFFRQRPARYVFIESSVDFAAELQQLKVRSTLFSLALLTVAFMGIAFLRRFHGGGTMNLNIRLKVFLAILAAIALPMALFFALATRFLHYSTELLLEDRRQICLQHLQMLAMNIRNNEQLRHRELENFKNRLNLIVDKSREEIFSLLEQDLGKMFHGYFVIRNDGLMLEKTPLANDLSENERKILHTVLDLFKSQGLRVFKELNILEGEYFERFRATPAGRQIIATGDLFDLADMDHFFLQDGLFFGTSKNDRGRYQLITYNLLPGKGRENSTWAFVGFMQDVCEVAYEFLRNKTEAWQTFYHRSGDFVTHTAVFTVESRSDGKFRPLQSIPRHFSDKSEFAAAIAHVSHDISESSWINWENRRVPVVFAAKKLDKLPIVAVARTAVVLIEDSRLLVLALGLLLYCLMLILIIALAISDTFLKPIQALMQGTAQIFSELPGKIIFNSELEFSQIIKRFNEMVDGMVERRRLERFVSSEAAKAIESEIRDNTGHQAARVSCAVLFMHISRFDRLCEVLEPDALIKCLNIYFSEMEAIILANHGVIDKYIGDAIMVVFTGNEGGDAGCCNDAVKAALAMLARRERIAEQLARENLSPIDYGIGIAHGEVIRGKIGAEAGRKDFTVIGDIVNLAARLESISRQHSSPAVFLSMAAAEFCRENFRLEPAGTMAIKGKKEPQEVFLIRGETHV